MEHETNALGRLYAVLREYRALSQNDEPIRIVWSKVLGIEPGQVGLELAVLAAELIPAARRQIDQANNPFHGTVWDLHEDDWAAPLLHERTTLDHGCSSLPANHVDYLGSLWNGLSSAGITEGRVPTEAEVASVIDGLCTVREEVEHDPELAPEVRDAMARRLTDLIGALTDLSRVGPSGVQAAATRILGDLVVEKVRQKAEPSKTLMKVGAFVLAAYTIVSPYSDFTDSTKALRADVGAVVETIAGEVVETAAESPEQYRLTAPATGDEQP